MSAILPPAHGLRGKTGFYVGAVRAGAAGRVPPVTRGYLFCTSCGGSAMSVADFASYSGVPYRAVRAWLDRKPVREDHAERIHLALHKVEA